MTSADRDTSVVTPTAFEAFDDCAAYVDGNLSRSHAITEARDVVWLLRDNYLRSELRAVRVLMREVDGTEADEAFSGEFEHGWVEVPDPHPVRGPLNKAQRAALIPMWRVEPKSSQRAKTETGGDR